MNVKLKPVKANDLEVDFIASLLIESPNGRDDYPRSHILDGELHLGSERSPPVFTVLQTSLGI